MCRLVSALMNSDIFFTWLSSIHSTCMYNDLNLPVSIKLHAMSCIHIYFDLIFLMKAVNRFIYKFCGMMVSASSLISPF